MIKFYGYPKCSTCKKAWQDLEAKNLEVAYVHIKETPPAKETLRKMYEKSNQPLRKFFNTSGLRYRELGLKEKLPTMTEEEMLELLASDGMLIKRPLLDLEKTVIIGYPRNGYEEIEG